jgi:cytidine diphosphoramidate kinase
MSKGTLIWITGLAGSGKTTLAQRVYSEICKSGYSAVHLDGDQMREVLGENSSHDIDGRKRTARIYAGFSGLLTSQGINVVVSTISLFHEIHELNRERNPGNYVEVLLDVKPEVLKTRDKKGLYSNSDGRVMGIDQRPEMPKEPHLVLKNNGLEDLEISTKDIIKKFMEKHGK